MTTRLTYLRTHQADIGVSSPAQVVDSSTRIARDWLIDQIFAALDRGETVEIGPVGDRMMQPGHVVLAEAPR